MALHGTTKPHSVRTFTQTLATHHPVEEGPRTASGSCRRPHHRCRRAHHRGGRTRPTPPRARVGARTPATSASGARSAAAPKKRPAPPTPPRARVGVAAVATVAPVRLHITCTDRGARRPAPLAAAPPVARDMAWSEAPPPPRRRGGSVHGGPAGCGAPILLALATV